MPFSLTTNPSEVEPLVVRLQNKSIYILGECSIGGAYHLRCLGPDFTTNRRHIRLQRFSGRSP